MVGRSVDKKDEIRAYIKARSKLGCSLKKLMTEISTAFGPSCVSYDTVRRWKKKFESGVESIKNAPKSGRPKSASRKEIVSKIKEIIEGDARFTVRDIARKVGISLSKVHLILKKHLKVRKIPARWVPHLLTDEQKRQRVKVAKMLLQMFPKYDKKQFANVVTGDETWVHYFEPVRKVSNKIWATKHSKRPIIAKRSLSTKKVLYAIFFSGEGVAIKVLVKKGKSITGKYYKDVVLKKLKKYYQKRRPATGFKHVRLLHDNAPAHASAIVTAFLKKEKVCEQICEVAGISLNDDNLVFSSPSTLFKSYRDDGMVITKGSVKRRTDKSIFSLTCVHNYVWKLKEASCDCSKAAPLLHFFFVHASMVSCGICLLLFFCHHENTPI